MIFVFKLDIGHIATVYVANPGWLIQAVKIKLRRESASICDFQFYSMYMYVANDFKNLAFITGLTL